MSDNVYQDGKISYSKFLSALFSSLSMFTLSMLCILNNLSLDLYSTMLLLKVVVPGATSFWLLGYVIGKKLDGLNNKITIRKTENEKMAYEIPSMFSVTDSSSDDMMNMENPNVQEES